MKRLIHLFAVVAFVLSGCSEGPDTGPVDSSKPFIDLPSDGMEFDRQADTGTLDVSTNVEEITCKPFDKWCEAGYANGVLTVSVSENNTYVARKTTVEVRGGNLVRQVFVTQNGIKVFAPADIFTDGTCSELKPGIGLSDIERITDEFYKTLATGLFDGTYDTEFRVQSYKAWPNPDVYIDKNKSFPPSLRDNPTGIAVTADSELVAFASHTHGQEVSLVVQEAAEVFNGTSYALRPGINKFTVSHGGLIYVRYHTPTGTEPDVKIHIVSGMVNGYFHSQKHSRERWTELLGKAPFEHFDLVGKKAHLTFETAAFRQYTPDGPALVDKYDEMVEMMEEFSGMVKYERVPRNRTYFLVHYDPSRQAFATYYYTAYDVREQQKLIAPDDYLLATHEAGHMHQVRPGLCWHGVTEVTVQLYGQLVMTAWGLPGLFSGSYSNTYDLAFRDILDAGKSYLEHYRYLCNFVPFWQLKLYMHDVLGNKDFYPNVHETARKVADGTSAGKCQIEFVKNCCDAAKLDLTAFFEAWGFLRAMNLTLTDYGTSTVTVTQKMVDDAKAYIAAKNYPKPARDFTRITDYNWTTYK